LLFLTENDAMTDKQELSLEQLQEFYSWLQGNVKRTEWAENNVPHLDAKTAWRIIYELQDWLRVLPDHFELCDECGELFDMDYGGVHVDDWEKVSVWMGYSTVTKEDEGKTFCERCRT